MRIAPTPPRASRSRRRLAALVGWSVLIVVVASVHPVDAQWVKLSDGLSFSDVQRFTMSPDGRRVVYVHDATVNGANELYGVAMTGGSPVLLSAVLPSGAEVRGTVFTADGSRVVYDANQDELPTFELYSVPPGGGTYVKLNTTLEGEDIVWRYQLCPGSGIVVYTAGTMYSGDLFRVPAAGGTAVPLNQAAYYHSFEVSPDCARVLFLQGLPTRLLSMPIGGGTPVELTLEDTEVGTFHASPDGQRAVFVASLAGEYLPELYSAPIAGGTAVRLNGDLVTGGSVSRFQISPSSDRVVYLADQATDGVDELYSVPITGGTAAKLNGLLVAGGDVLSYAISPDGSRVVYRADQQTNDVAELYSVPIGDGAVVKLNGALVAGGNVLDFAISPDSQWVVYRADQVLDELPSGFRVPVAGPASAHALIWSRPVVLDSLSYRIGSNSRYVIVKGNSLFVDGIQRLWQVNLAPTPHPFATELIPASAFTAAGDVTSFDVAANGNIAYIADQDTDEEYELYGIPLVFLDDFETGDTSAWLTP